jgi:hypothetical protein
MIDNFAAWKEELLFTGRIVQDEDETVSWEERHRRFLRYIELVEQLDGTERRDALAALLQSVQMTNDYGGYQTTYRVMGRFPDQEFTEVFVAELPALIMRQPDWAGDFSWEWPTDGARSGSTRSECLTTPSVAPPLPCGAQSWATSARKSRVAS